MAILQSMGNGILYNFTSLFNPKTFARKRIRGRRNVKPQINLT